MSIENYYNTTVTVQRLATVTGNKKNYQTHLSNVACQIQPLEPSISQDIEGGFGKDKLLFCAALDIIEGDRIIHGADTYKVVGVEKYSDYSDDADHMEITIRIFKT